MITIHHISDLHIGFDPVDPLSKQRAGNFLARLAERWRAAPDASRYLLITGDIVQHGMKAEYEDAAAMLSPFRGKLLLVPGNHDYGAQGLGFSWDSVDYFDRYLAAMMVRPHTFKMRMLFREVLDDQNGTRVLAAGLNSCSQTPTPVDIAKGILDGYQLRDLQGLLEDPSYTSLRRLVFLHHRPTEKGSWAFAMKLHGREELMNIVRNQADVLAFGHQGKMLKVSGLLPEFLQIPEEPMQEADLSKENIRLKYTLNANRSVADHSYYEIKFEGTAPPAVQKVTI